MKGRLWLEYFFCKKSAITAIAAWFNGMTCHCTYASFHIANHIHTFRGWPELNRGKKWGWWCPSVYSQINTNIGIFLIWAYGLRKAVRKWWWLCISENIARQSQPVSEIIYKGEKFRWVIEKYMFSLQIETEKNYSLFLSLESFSFVIFGKKTE